MTVTPVYNQTLPDLTLPYITRAQYRANPGAMETQNLIIGSNNQVDQDAELDRIILQASGWCDNCAEQPLTAQATTETMRAPVQTDGRLRLHPRQHPIVAVTGLSFGPDPAYMSALADLSGVWVENQSVIAPMTSMLATGWTGPLQFGTARPGNRVFVALSYVAGYPVTRLTVAALTTDTTLTVADSTGIIPGLTVRLTQGGDPTGTGSNQSTLSQTSAVVQSVNSITNVVTLTKALGTAFAINAGVTAMPTEVEQACAYVVTALLRQRSSGGLVMRGGNASMTISKPGKDEPGAEEFAEAESILCKYRPVVP